MSEHTPGPWHVMHETWELSTVYAKDWTVIATCRAERSGDDVENDAHAEAVKDANARLIAAAPKMADELVRLRAENERLRALLREASGFVWPDTCWSYDEPTGYLRDRIDAAIAQGD